MDRSTAICPVEDYPSAGELLHDDDLSATIRANFSELSEKLNRLCDIYGDSLQGAHARAAAAAAKRAELLASLLP